MSVTATAMKISTQSLTGSLAVLNRPPGLDQLGEVWLTADGDWTFSDSAAGSEFPVVTGDTVRLPVGVTNSNSDGQSLYVKGSGTLKCCWLAFDSFA